jgi:hypothetical protein
MTKPKTIADHVRAKIADEKPIPYWPTDPRTVTVPILGWVR